MDHGSMHASDWLHKYAALHVLIVPCSPSRSTVERQLQGTHSERAMLTRHTIACAWVTSTCHLVSLSPSEPQ